MSQPATVILTAPDPTLLDAVRSQRPDLRTLVIGSRPPETGVEGRLWCFIDWLLPEISGLEMCRLLRDAPATSHAHITMILDANEIDASETDARQRALQVGADDYVIGPLSPERLLDKLQLYQAAPVDEIPSPRLVHGELVVDLAAYQVRYKGRSLPLPPNEFRLLTHFIENPGKLFTRKSLIEKVGKESEPIDERTVDVWVGRLRRALSSNDVPDSLRTVRSLGYVFDVISPG